MAGVIVTFAAVAVLLSAVPGPDTLLVLRTGLRGGRRRGIASALGCAAGSLVWSARRSGGVGIDEDSPVVSPRVRTTRGAFLYGLTGDLLNPKMGLFYVAVIPQVVPHSVPILTGTLMFAGSTPRSPRSTCRHWR
jgi:threonine/homoserine/homoserine lactone efflux protein